MKLTRTKLIISVWSFQSPRSGKFVSDLCVDAFIQSSMEKEFQSPKSGKFVSDYIRKDKTFDVEAIVSIP